jgi:hypothetical protein
MASGGSGTALRTSPLGPEAVTPPAAVGVTSSAAAGVTSPAAVGVTSPAVVGVTSSTAAAATVGEGVTRRKRAGWGAAPTMGFPAGLGPDRDCIINLTRNAF